VASWPDTGAPLPAPPPLVSEWVKPPQRTPDGPHKLYVGGFDPLHTEGQAGAYTRPLLSSS